MREPCGKLGLSKALWGEVGRGIYHVVRVILWHVVSQCALTQLASRAATPFKLLPLVA
jgi:hypothetical protein